jgi:hypothetical protein
MSGYITSMLHKYQHPPSKCPQYAPHIWTEPAYGQCIQYAASAADITCAQGIVGTLLYYARSVDPTLIMPIITIASRLSTATATTMDAVSHLLDYFSTKPHATIRYYASDMQLKVHSNASYLSEPNAKSRIGGYFFLGNSKHSKGTSLSNGPLMCQSTVLKQVISSFAEAEYGAIFVNAKTSTSTRETLKEIGRPQDATELKTNNTTADGIPNKTVLQKRSKAMDMHYYWMKDRIEQGQFDVSWAPSDNNLGGYFTKHHSPSHHKLLRPFYLHSHAEPMVRHKTKHPVLRGCVNLCTLVQTSNLPVPSLGPHPRNYTGVPRQMVVPTLAPPPYFSTGQSYTCNMAISKKHDAATPYYSMSRFSAMLDSPLQKTVTSQCSAVRTHATSDANTLTPHHSSGCTRTPAGSLMYRRMFPRSGILYYNCNTHSHYFSNSWLLAFLIKRSCSMKIINLTGMDGLKAVRDGVALVVLMCTCSYVIMCFCGLLL